MGEPFLAGAESGRSHPGDEDLRKRIRSERAQRRMKQSFKRGVFATVSGLVHKFALRDSFLKKLDSTSVDRLRKDLKFSEIKKKIPFAAPLFALSSEDQYRVTMAIITRIDNPYLYFAHAPDELLVCRSLFSLNPSLEPERLAYYHLETLLLREFAVEQTNALLLETEVVTREMMEYKENEETVLLHMARKMGFDFSPDGAVYIRNLREKIIGDSDKTSVSAYGISPDDIWGETLVEKYSIGIRVAMNILGRNLHAVRESYKEELLEEGRLRLDSVRERIVELHRLIVAIESMRSQSGR
jgi:hypothetical protein